MQFWSRTLCMCASVIAITFSCAWGESGVTDKEILIGSSLALSGPGGPLGIQTNHGMLACINAANEAGGVNGKTIKVISYDDEYNPLKCIENTKKLLDADQVFALSCYVGTPTAGKAMPLWRNAKVPLVGFYTGVVPILRNPFVRYNIHIRASYYQETAAMIDRCVNELKLKKIAVFYQYDSFGEAIKKDTETALAKYSLVPVAYGTFDKTTVNVTEGLNAVKAAAPEVIVMVGAYGTHPILAEFVRQAKKAGLTKTIFFTLNLIGPEELAKELGKDSGQCVISQVVPPYDDLTIPVVDEYRKLLKKYYPKDKPDFVSLEGFLNAKVLVEGLKRAGAGLTREGFVDAIDGLKGFDLGGVSVTYGAADHEGIDKVYLTGIKEGKYYEVKDWPGFLN